MIETTSTLSPALPSSSSPAVTRAAVVLVAVIGLIQPSCGAATNCQDPNNAQSAVCVVEGAVVDCTGVSSLSSSVAIATPIVEKLIASARQSDGTINWSSIEQQLVTLALQYGTCVIAEIWNKYINGSTSGGGSGSDSGSARARSQLAQPSSTDFAREFDRIRARVAPGRAFKTSGGKL